jgi:hypothetical protein
MYLSSPTLMNPFLSGSKISNPRVYSSEREAY